MTPSLWHQKLLASTHPPEQVFRKANSQGRQSMKWKGPLGGQFPARKATVQCSILDGILEQKQGSSGNQSKSACDSVKGVRPVLISYFWQIYHGMWEVNVGEAGWGYMGTFCRIFVTSINFFFFFFFSSEDPAWWGPDPALSSSSPHTPGLCCMPGSGVFAGPQTPFVPWSPIWKALPPTLSFPLPHCSNSKFDCNCIPFQRVPISLRS